MMSAPWWALGLGLASVVWVAVQLALVITEMRQIEDKTKDLDKTATWASLIAINALALVGTLYFFYLGVKILNLGKGTEISAFFSRPNLWFWIAFGIILLSCISNIIAVWRSTDSSDAEKIAVIISNLCLSLVLIATIFFIVPKLPKDIHKKTTEAHEILRNKAKAKAFDAQNHAEVAALEAKLLAAKSKTGT